MKTIITSAVIDSLRSKVDGSLGLTVSTPEYSADEKTAFFELQGKNVELTIKPTDETPTDEIKVDREAGEMSPSQELRWRIGKKWDGTAKLQEKYPDKQMYYRHVMRGIIEQVEI